MRKKKTTVKSTMGRMTMARSQKRRTTTQRINTLARGRESRVMEKVQDSLLIRGRNEYTDTEASRK